MNGDDRTIVARAPGRVNLIGDHTDYTGGVVAPMAIDRWTEVRGRRTGRMVRLTSASQDGVAQVPLDVEAPNTCQPPWSRYVAGVVAEMRPTMGFDGDVTTDIPVGAGLSSSAALEVAIALALGHDGGAAELAKSCRRAEHLATGVPTGIMDQLCIAGGVAGHLLVIDCTTLEISPVPVPAEVEVIVELIHHRTLVGSAYTDRVEQCRQVEDEIGPLRDASADDVEGVRDPLLRRRARHVVSENERVRSFASALGRGDVAEAGRLMRASHDSLRDDYEVSTGEMDRAVARWCATPGVLGARMTGGGFGGCVVAIGRHGSGEAGWVVRPVEGAQVSGGGR